MAFKGLASSHKGALPISDTYESCVFPWSMIREPLGYLFVIPQYTVLCHVLWLRVSLLLFSSISLWFFEGISEHIAELLIYEGIWYILMKNWNCVIYSYYFLFINPCTTFAWGEFYLIIPKLKGKSRSLIDLFWEKITG